MAITYHKAINDSGGVIGDEIFSGNVGELLPEISLSDQLLGAIISRKFYIANDSDLDVNISNLSMHDFSVFSAIMFESTGDSQLVGDLTGFEVDESPINVTIPANGHKSFWVQLDVPIGSTKTNSFGTVDIKKIF